MGVHAGELMSCEACNAWPGRSFGKHATLDAERERLLCQCVQIDLLR